MQKNIIFCDDPSLLRNGIKSYIHSYSNFKVTLEGGTWDECKKIAESFSHNKNKETSSYIAIVDISFKAEYTTNGHEEYCGFEIIKMFSALGIPCIAYSSHDSGGFIEHATSAAVGAKGFVSKNADEKILLNALEAVSAGKTYIQAELVTGLLEVRDITQTFTKKEKLVAESLTIYNTNADVAATLGISEKTVVNYLTILYDKAGVKNKIEFLEKMGRL